MKRDLFFPVCLGFCLLGLGTAFADVASDSENIRVLPPSLIAQADAGQIERGPAKSTVLQRFSAWYTDDILINDRLEIKGGVGGLFYYAYPTGNPGEQAGYKNATDFGPGISEADAVYRFGDLAHSPAFLQMG